MHSSVLGVIHLIFYIFISGPVLLFIWECRYLPIIYLYILSNFYFIFYLCNNSNNNTSSFDFLFSILLYCTYGMYRASFRGVLFFRILTWSTIFWLLLFFFLLFLVFYCLIFIFPLCLSCSYFRITCSPTLAFLALKLPFKIVMCCFFVVVITAKKSL